MRASRAEPGGRRDHPGARRRGLHQHPPSPRLEPVKPTENGGCLIDFYVDFEFRSKMLQKIIGVLFNEAVRRMVAAFETRARDLYGDGTIPAGDPSTTSNPA